MRIKEKLDMASKEDLKTILMRIDGKEYKAYKDIGGNFEFGPFTLHIDHVQGVDDRPLTQNVIPFYYPPEIESYIKTHNS